MNNLTRKTRGGKIFGTNQRPRVSVYRSNKHLYAQLIKDEDGKTLLAISDKDIKVDAKSQKMCDLAFQLGLNLAEKMKALKIDKIVFDRNGYAYHGQIKSLAEGIRKGGINF